MANELIIGAAVIIIIVIVTIVLYWLWKRGALTRAKAAPEYIYPEYPGKEFRCPACGTVVDANALSCSGCGVEFKAGVFECPSCGALADPNMLECSQCGEIFETEPSFCPACGAIVRADATTCTKCNETFWSPIHPPKIPAEGEEKKEETVEGQEVSGEVATTSS